MQTIILTNMAQSSRQTRPDDAITIIADGQRLIIVNRFQSPKTTVDIVRVALVKLNNAKVRKIEIECCNRTVKSSVSATFDPASASTHRRKIDRLAQWLLSALSSVL